MKCPAPIAEVLLAMLRDGLLACRAAGWSGDAKRCATEADHLHNIPSLLADFTQERFLYYWEVERPSFAQRCDAEELQRWEEHWLRLGRFTEQPGELSLAR